jgi:hypothetical protein
MMSMAVPAIREAHVEGGLSHSLANPPVIGEKRCLGDESIVV